MKKAIVLILCLLLASMVFNILAAFRISNLIAESESCNNDIATENCSENVDAILVISRSKYEPMLDEPIADPLLEECQYVLHDEIPLTKEEQKILQAICKDFNVPYALALGLIEKETNFANVYGDNGESAGYMQIQEKWNLERMKRLGVTDLSDPESNFKVGVDLLSELYKKYESWDLVLTIYNYGHNPGYITNYAYDVLDNYNDWSAVLGTVIN